MGHSGESGIPRFASFAPTHGSLRRIGDTPIRFLRSNSWVAQANRGYPDSLPSLQLMGRSGESGIPRFASFAPTHGSLRRIGDTPIRFLRSNSLIRFLRSRSPREAEHTHLGQTAGLPRARGGVTMDRHDRIEGTAGPGAVVRGAVEEGAEARLPAHDAARRAGRDRPRPRRRHRSRVHHRAHRRDRGPQG